MKNFRHVIQIADSTKLVSLPSKWCKKYDVKKGDLLQITEKGRTLEITTNTEAHIKRGFVDVTSASLILPRIIHAMYIRGYDEIEIRYNSPEQLKEIQNAFSTTVIGYEIISQSSSSLVVKSIASTSESEFDIVLRRTFLVLESLSQGVYDAINENNFETLDSLKVLEITTNRTTGFCRRLLNTCGSKEYEYPMVVYSMIEELEKIGDEYKYLCDFFKEEKNIKSAAISPEILRLYKELPLLIGETQKVFYKYELKKILALYTQRKRIIKSANGWYSNPKLAPTEAKLVHHCVIITQQLANIFSFIMTLRT